MLIKFQTNNSKFIEFKKLKDEFTSKYKFTTEQCNSIRKQINKVNSDLDKKRGVCVLENRMNSLKAKQSKEDLEKSARAIKVLEKGMNYLSEKEHAEKEQKNLVPKLRSTLNSLDIQQVKLTKDLNSSFVKFAEFTMANFKDIVVMDDPVNKILINSFDCFSKKINNSGSKEDIEKNKRKISKVILHYMLMSDDIKFQI
ncbi:MAG: hypothetical protein JHC93_02740 [Parachlamydiales bacterium]|nr:hypothetical protein [Parachlamydiales bacterium]